MFQLQKLQNYGTLLTQKYIVHESKTIQKSMYKNPKMENNVIEVMDSK